MNVKKLLKNAKKTAKHQEKIKIKLEISSFLNHVFYFFYTNCMISCTSMGAAQFTDQVLEFQ